MLVKCKCHGFKIDRDTAFKVTSKDKNGKNLNSYYCSKEIYEEIFIERDVRDKIQKIVYEVLGGDIPYSMFRQELALMYGLYPAKEMLKYLEYRKDNLYAYINRKQFVSPYAKVRYFIAVFKGEMKDWAEESKVVEIDNFDFMPVKYTARRRKPPLEEYEDGDDEI